MKKTLKLLCYTLALSSVITHADELIIDGGFDEPSLNDGEFTTSSSYWIFDSTNQLGIWNPNDYHSSFYPDMAVGNVLFLNAERTALYNTGQVLTEGETYNLSVEIGKRMDTSTENVEINLNVNGQTIPFNFDVTLISGSFASINSQIIIDSSHQSLIDSGADVYLELINPASATANYQINFNNLSLTVTPPPPPFNPAVDTDGDGMRNGWENHYGLDMGDPSDKDGDLDQDGFTNLEEFEAATDPTDLTSYPAITSTPGGNGDNQGSTGSLDWNECEAISFKPSTPNTWQEESCTSGYALVAYNCQPSHHLSALPDYVHFCELTGPNSLRIKNDESNFVKASMKCCRIRD